jgi:sec-independent protein translocase protein TatA
MFENIGLGELSLILIVVLIFFGPKKIPEIAKGIGKGISEFRKAMKDVQSELTKPEDSPNKPFDSSSTKDQK